MPVTSVAQQKLMGIVHGLQKGTVDPKKVSAKAKDTASRMKPSAATEFASTKHKGLPKKKNKVKEQILTEDIHSLYLAAILVTQAAMLSGGLAMLAGKHIDSKGVFPNIDDVKRWWKNRKDDKPVKSIIAKIKSDPEMIEFFKMSQTQQRGKFKKLVASKLSGEELQYLNRINKTDLQENRWVALKNEDSSPIAKVNKVKEQLMQGHLGQVYAVKKPYSGCELSSLVTPIDPLVGMGAGHEVVADQFHGVFADKDQADKVANELYEEHLQHESLIEEKKGTAVEKIKKAIDKLEKKRKEHVNLAKEDPKSASQHKGHIANLTTKIDDLMTKMERVEKSKKVLDGDTEKKNK